MTAVRAFCSDLARISRSAAFRINRKMYHASATQLLDLDKSEVDNFVNSFDTVLTDCDGVLWLEKNEISGAAQTLNTLRSMGKGIFYITNNSTKSRDEFASKATALGFDATKEEVLSSAYLVAHYLKSINFTKKVYLIGSHGIAQELKAVGIDHFGVGPDPITPNYREEIYNLKLDSDVGAVVVGFDEHFSFAKLIKAASYLRNPDIIFIGTNTDERFPLKGGMVMPGTGCIVRSVETCAERSAFIVGKPHDYVGKFLNVLNLKAERTLMIGDRCNTDIELGVRCGLQTLLVLTGVTSLEDVQQKAVKPLPDLVVPSLASLLPYLKC